MQGFLNTLVSNNVLADYKNLTVTYSTTQMGTMLVSFDAAWLSPINYIRVNFNFDALSGYAQNFTSQTLGSGTVVNGQISTSPTASASSTTQTSTTVVKPTHVPTHVSDIVDHVASLNHSDEK
jgi:ABC-type protease/lipase transport system fused ATPase/permease subunit